jgi:hypothetical protein
MKKIYLFSILSIFSLNLFCQYFWEKHPDNPVLVPGPSGEWDEDIISPNSVIYYDNIYHMWYSNGKAGLTSRIGHATSPDGIAWTKDINNPVLDVGPDGDWDDNGISGSKVLVIDSILHMWYTGSDYLTKDRSIGHATSLDGITWTKDTNNPVLEKGDVGEWDDLGVYSVSVIYDGSEYHLCYNGWNVTATQVGHATSPDGVTWTKDPLNPVLTYEAEKWDYTSVYASTVLFDSNSYHMWYVGGGGKDWHMGYATSVDGSVWTKWPDNPIFSKESTGSWDSYSVNSAIVIDSSGVKYKMWYFGSQTSITGSIGYAESDTRIPYLSVIDSKPVFDKTDIVVAEIVLDGTIYIVPEGISHANDSIIKYKFASVDALANTEVQLPLTDLSIGKYTILAVSPQGVISTNPFLLEVVADAAPPVLTLEKDTVKIGDPINASSTKDGMIYLVKIDTPHELCMILHPFYCLDSILALAGFPGEISTTGLSVKDYCIHAVDIYGIISEPDIVTIASLESGGIEENTYPGISIYPNPANNLLTIETNEVGPYSIELNAINGQLIYSTKIVGPTNHIDLSSFQKGVYIITIRLEDNVATRKIIKL